MRNSLALVAVQAVIIIALAGALVYFGRDELRVVMEREEDEIATPSRVTDSAGAQAVSISAEAQRANGILTRPLAAHRAALAADVYGSVVDIGELQTAHAKYLAARSEAKLLAASLERSAAEYQRARALFRDDISVSERSVQAAHAEWKADQVKLEAAQAAANAVLTAVRQEWGDAIVDWMRSGSDTLARLLSAREVLLQLTFPYGVAAPASVRVSALGDGQAEHSAIRVGAAARADPQLTGKTYFYRAPAHDLRVAAQVSARYSDGQQSGVIVPAGAVVWHGGKAWIFVREAADSFVRREVELGSAVGGDWFGFGARIKPGAEAVVAGAQLLLSEELRYQIKNENDD